MPGRRPDFGECHIQNMCGCGVDGCPLRCGRTPRAEWQMHPVASDCIRVLSVSLGSFPNHLILGFLYNRENSVVRVRFDQAWKLLEWCPHTCSALDIHDAASLLLLPLLLLPPGGPLRQKKTKSGESPNGPGKEPPSSRWPQLDSWRAGRRPRGRRAAGGGRAVPGALRGEPATTLSCAAASRR